MATYLNLYSQDPLVSKTHNNPILAKRNKNAVYGLTDSKVKSAIIYPIWNAGLLNACNMLHKTSSN